MLVVTALALIIRLPYWRTIPAAGDEAKQVVYALQIAQGQGFPLVGNDAYAGPFFFYLLALLIRLGASDPFMGRTVVLVTGTLTATITYAWCRQLGGRSRRQTVGINVLGRRIKIRGNRVASLTAAGLVAANPHLILLNSHVGGTTLLLPFFTTLFLYLLSRAVETDRPGWLIAAAVMGGLAIQSNPVAGLAVAGGWVWATFRVRRSQRLGRRWPLWPLVTGLCVAFVYSPVIVYNITSGMDSVEVLDQRPYLWETHPTIQTFLSNESRLAQQLVRQVSGALAGDETFRSLLGVPLVFLVWMVAGLAYVTRRVSLLPLAVISPFVLVLPVVSSHYGLLDPIRFTSLLTPVFAVCMGLFFTVALDRAAALKSANRTGRLPVRVATCALLVALMAYPLVSLWRYYRSIEQNQQSGRALMNLSHQMVAANDGEPAYISHSLGTMAVKGIPYVPRAYLVLADIRHEFLPPDQIVGRLFELPGAASMLISDQDAEVIRQFAPLTRWAGPANEEAQRRGYGLYILGTGSVLTRPDFVRTGDEALGVAPRVPVGTPIGEGIELIGYDTPTSIPAGEMLHLTVYWKATAPMPSGTYMGFVHLSDPATTALVAQDDHVLGQDQYPLNAWQSQDVVVDHYVLPVPDDVAPGEYALRAGVYTWPNLTRLNVAEHPDDVIELGHVEVGE